MRTSPLAVTMSASLSYVTWSALKVTIWFSSGAGAGARDGAPACAAAAAVGSARTMGSADHQTNLVRNAAPPAPMILVRHVPIAPRERGDNRPKHPFGRDFA